MTTTGHHPPSTTSPAGNPMGFGRMLRKEDARFLRGQGHFLDDLSMPGMLHAAILRSPVAHARIASIDTSEAEAHPKVKAVITGAVLESLNLAWMPTLSADVQAVLATDKVRFQGQEVAMVIAEDRYAARDALELIDVDYDVLPAVVDARRAMDPGAPVIRDDVEGRTDNHIFDWEAGDKAKADEVFARADVVVSQEMLYPRSHPAPMETCGTIASMDRVTGKLTVWSTNQAPHAHRTIYALVAGIPEHNIQIISPDIGGGFGNKVGIYPRIRPRRRGLDHHGQARQVGGGPQREPHLDLVRPRLPHARRDRRDPGGQDHRPAGRRAGRPRGVQRHRAADQVPGRVLPHLHRELRPRGRPLQGLRGLHEQGAGRRRLRLLVPDHRGRVPRRADGRRARGRARHRPRGAAAAQPAQPEQFPYTHHDRVGVRLRRLPAHAAEGHGDGRVRRAAPRAGREEGARRADGHRRQLLHRGGGGGPPQAHGHPRPGDGRRLRAAAAPDGQGPAPDLGADPGPGPRDDLRPDRGARARHPA